MKTKVNLEFEVEMTQDEGDEIISCYIPEIDSHFSANTVKEIDERTKALVKSFIQANCRKSKNNSL